MTRIPKVLSRRTELKYFVIIEKVHKRRVSIKHINTDLMIVNPLIKGLPPKFYAGHVKNMSIMSTTEC